MLNLNELFEMNRSGASMYIYGFSSSISVATWVALNGDVSVEDNGAQYAVNGKKVIYKTPVTRYEDLYEISGTTYYLDPDAIGTGDGLSPENAFTTIGLANDDRYVGGDALLIKAGSEFLESNLTMSSSGTETNPILVGVYGDINHEKFPVIDNRTLVPTLTWTAHPTLTDVYTAPLDNSGLTIGRLWMGGTEQVNEFLRAYSGDYTADIIPLKGFHHNGSEVRVYHEGGAPTLDFYMNTYYSCRILSTSFTNYHDIDFRGGTAAVYVGGDIRDVNFTNCRLGYGSQAGVKFRDGRENSLPRNVVLDRCIIDSNWVGDFANAYKGGNSDSRGCDEGFNIREWVDNIELRNCKLYNWGHHVIAGWADESLGYVCSNVNIHHNYINGRFADYGGTTMMNENIINFKYYNNISDNTAGSSVNIPNPYVGFNIFVDTKTCWMRSETPYNNGSGMTIHAGEMGTNGGILENNIMYKTSGSGIDMQAYRGVLEQSIRNTKVRNNIMFLCGRGGNWAGEIVPDKSAYYQEQATAPSVMENVDVESNLISTDGTASVVHCNGVDYATVEEFNNAITGTGLSNGNIDINPEFIDTAKFIFSNTSPLIGLGIASSILTDFNDNSIVQGIEGSGYDLGLYNQGTIPFSYIHDVSDVLLTTGQMLHFNNTVPEFIETDNKRSSGDDWAAVADFKLDNISTSSQQLFGEYYASNGARIYLSNGVPSVRLDIRLLSSDKIIVKELPNFVLEDVSQLGVEVSSENYVRIYFNGNIIHEEILIIGDITEFVLGKNFVIGAGYTSGSNPFGGKIGNISFWKAPLGEIGMRDMFLMKEKALYKKHGVIWTDSMVISPNYLDMWFPMIEGIGTTITDAVTGTSYNMSTHVDAEASWSLGRGHKGGLQIIKLNNDMTIPSTMHFSETQAEQIVATIGEI